MHGVQCRSNRISMYDACQNGVEISKQPRKFKESMVRWVRCLWVWNYLPDKQLYGNRSYHVLSDPEESWTSVWLSRDIESTGIGRMTAHLPFQSGYISQRASVRRRLQLLQYLAIFTRRLLCQSVMIGERWEWSQTDGLSIINCIVYRVCWVW